MIRVRVRHNDSKKSLFFDESIEFPLLLRKICAKLGVHHERLRGGIDPSEFFSLSLENQDIEVQQTNQIKDDDELVLRRKTASSDAGPTVPRVTRSNSIHGVGTIVRQKIDGAISQNDDHPVKTEGTEDVDVNANSGTPNSSGIPVKKEDVGDGDGNAHTRATKDGDIAVKKEDVDDSDEAANSCDNDPSEQYDNDDSDVISISSDENEDSSYSDGTEEEYESSSSEDEDAIYSNDYDYENARRCKRTKRNPKKALESPLEVRMENRDIPSAPGKPDQRSDKDEINDEMEEKSMLVNGAGKKKAEQEVKHRIIKLLNTGFHDQSNEHEAKNAMKLAQRLMRKYNLSQALLLKEREAKNSQNAQDDEVLKGGMVRVKILNRKTGKASLFSRWLSRLVHPICDNFGVQCFVERRRCEHCAVVFYGIYSNAQLAGYAYKVSAERIAQMIVEYTPEKQRWRNISTKSSRLSYAIGIVHGISEDVKRNLAMEKEQRKRKLERAKLAESTGEAYAESDEEDFDDDNDGPGISLVKEEGSSNSVDSLNSLPPNSGNSQPKSISGIDLQKRVEELEKEEQAALVLVNHNEKIAEEVLKEQNIKVKRGRAGKPIQFDQQSYEIGIEDSKEIDINQRAIRDEVKVKVEKS